MPDGLIGLFQIETVPIVVDFKQCAIRCAPQVNRDFAGIGVLGDIRKGFLADMEQSHCIYLLQVRQRLFWPSQHHFELGILPELCDQSSETFNETFSV